MIVRVPASTANLGAGFDALGLALGLHASAGLVTADVTTPASAEDDAATIAFRRAGGRGRIWVRSDIPIGRGLGSSAAVRVAGAALAAVERGEQPDRAVVCAVAADLEGHPDNAAAAVHGGLVVSAGGHSVRVATALRPAVVTWSPSIETSTDASRRRLRATVPFADAVFNVGRAALLVAALAAGDVEALRTATEDRLHQDQRLDAVPASRQAMEALLGSGVWCAWLSGSGPTVAALCDRGVADDVAASFPTSGPSAGEVRVLAIDHEGLTVEQAEPAPS